MNSLTVGHDITETFEGPPDQAIALAYVACGPGPLNALESGFFFSFFR